MSDRNDAIKENNGTRERRICRTGKHAGFSCGVFMIAAGALWLLARSGLVSFAWLNGVPVWPILLIFCGMWIVAAGLFRRLRDNSRMRC